MVDVKENRHVTDQITAIAREISKLAIACDIKLGEPGIAEKILKGDDSVCRRKNENAFRQIRAHLMALFPLQESVIDRLGAEETRGILDQVRQSILDLREMGRTGRAPDD